MSCYPPRNVWQLTWTACLLTIHCFTVTTVKAAEPKNGWIVVYGSNGYSYRSFPKSLGKAIKDLNRRRQSIKSIAYAPNGGWIVLYGKNGHRFRGIRRSLNWKLIELYHSGHRLKQVAFTPYGGWVVLYGRNGWASRGLPRDVARKLHEIHRKRREIKHIAFTSSGGWAVLYGSNGAAWRGIPTAAVEAIRSQSSLRQTFQKISFGDRDEWILLYGKKRYSGNVRKAMEDRLRELAGQSRSLNTVTFAGKRSATYVDYDSPPRLSRVARLPATIKAPKQLQARLAKIKLATSK